jgi:hypothetical protein
MIIIKVITLRRIGLVGHLSHIGGMRNAYRILVGRSEGKRPLVTTRHMWEDYIKMDVDEIGCEVVDWINVTGT